MPGSKWELTEAPFVPLRNLVMFPGMTVPLIIGRERSVAAVEEAYANDRMIVVCTQKSEMVDEPGASDLYDVGVGCEILQLQQKMPDGNLRVIAEGIRRVKIKKFVDGEKFTKAIVEPFIETFEMTPEIKALMRVLTGKFDEYFRINKRLLPEMLLGLSEIEEPNQMADIVAANIGLSISEKQEILSIEPTRDRLSRLIDLVSSELEVLNIQNKIESEVRNKIDKTQKEFYLREQLKAIQKELGESSSEFSNDISEFRKKLEGRPNLPVYVVEAINEQLDKLEKMPSMAAEAAVVRNYLDWIFSLPWEVKTEDCIDIKQAKQILDEDHYDLDEVKERILEYLAVRKLSPKAKSPILCLVGPPGVGKTSLGKSIARAMGRKFVRVSLGGIKDEAEIRGHRRTYVGALPGRIVQGIKLAGSSNPVFLLDEIDKVGLDFRGDPTAALLEALDPEQNTAFSDHYLEIPYDLSGVLFVTTANVSHTIPRALFDRMELITIPGYTQYDKIHIAKKFLIPKQLKENGLTADDVELPDETIDGVIRLYTREAGLRTLERRIASIMRKVAKNKVETGKLEKTTILPENLSDYLDVPIFKSDVQLKKDEVGIATGLAVTENGGEVLFIECTLMEGSGKLILTGQLGDVMKESATAAMSFVRSHRKELGLPESYSADKTDIHIHFPEGAIPKDGPSAGIGIITSLVSAISGLPVRSDVAMTGEITLRGSVLPIGGVKEKVLAAHRYGIKTVILPKDNEADSKKIPADVLSEIKIVFVENVFDVIKIAIKHQTPRRKK